ncbi:YncE family protein, partial [Klebsiella pneumoniae]
AREILSHPPGSLVIADGRLFVGQVFSEVILVIDLATHAIVKRIAILGGGEGQLAVSHDEKKVYFASNTINQFYIIDSATYDVTTVPYPEGGRGCMSLLRHPTQPLLY